MSKAFDIPQSGFNLIIKNDAWDEALEFLLFHGETVNRIPVTSALDLFDVLVMLDLFTSKSQAKKNWRHAGGPAFPPGFHDWFIGKRKTRITVWNPIE